MSSIASQNNDISQKIQIIKDFFSRHNKKLVYTNQKGNVVTCKMIDDGIVVDCLINTNHKNFLPWGVFITAIEILIKNDGITKRGYATGGEKLGSEQLPIDSVEGYIAAKIYAKNEGDTVFRRISPVARILIESSVCKNQRGDLELL